MKYLITVLLLISISVHTLAQNIGYIETTPSWYVIYDTNAKKIHTANRSQGSLVGYGSNFYIIQKGDFYYTHEPNGRKINTFHKNNIGEIINIQGDTFTSRKGKWIYVWHKNGNKLYTITAR